MMEETYEFQRIQPYHTHVSFIWVDMRPGATIRLHKHHYEEIFIIQEGLATFTVGSATLEAYAGQSINISDKQLK